MRSVTIFFMVLSVLALVVVSEPISAQNQQYPFPGYPPQFASLRTSRPRSKEGPGLRTKFNKIRNSVPNQYLVVLNDDAVPAGNTPEELLRKCEEPARKRALKSTASSGRRMATR